MAIAALRTFHDNAEVCHRACWALSYIANGGNEICAKISALGGCTIICAAAQSFPQHKGMRAWACCVPRIPLSSLLYIPYY